MNENSLSSFDYTVTQNLFVILWHRNHLPVVLNYPLPESGIIYTYNFTTAASQAYGNNQSNLGGGKFGMIGGDANADGTVDTDDKTIWAGQAGNFGYYSGDFTMDGQVHNVDKNEVWTSVGIPSVQIPTITTENITNITQATATGGGNVTNNGGAAVTARGICWSLSSNPDLSDNFTNDGSGLGSFVSSLSGLNPDTEYFVRAYATNSEGTAYGNEVSFTSQPPTWSCGEALIDDRDSQSYNTVLIGDQCWMADNLNVGMMIVSNTSSDNQTDNGILEKYCYDNDPANCDEYGGLYQWEEAMLYTTIEETQGICPDDWHLPSDGEYCTLATFLDPTVTCSGTGLRGADAGGKMKETGLDHWNSPNTGATNESGFTALPGAYRYYNGSFDYLGYYGYYWQSTDYGTNHYYWYMAFNSPQVGRHTTPHGFGFSVRCIKN